ncbi:MAG: PKD domain-containing protein [Planctomycetes bacterium]|nr:PKD domain-containing protein [Planctomycetota bacterium]
MMGRRWGGRVLGGRLRPRLPAAAGAMLCALLARTHAAAPELVKDIDREPGSSAPLSLAAVGDRLFFTADDGEHGYELWVSDGTEAGTVLVKNIRPGGDGSSPEFLTAVGGRMFFTANDGEHGVELWVSDGTDAGTVLVKDIRAGGDGPSPDSLTAVGDRVFFTADDGVHGEELWVSDGTESGTVLVKDIWPGLGSPYPEGPRPGHLTAVGDRLYFSANDGEHGDELWISDGTGEGTFLFCEIVPGSGGSSPQEMTPLDQVLFLTAQTGTCGRELWVIPLGPVPTARFAMSPEGCQRGRSVRLDAAASTTPEGTAITGYAWTLGDGTEMAGREIEYDYPAGAAGVFPICLTVTNDAALSRTTCRSFCIGEIFRRGDANADSSINIADAVFSLNYQFASGASPTCLKAADANDDGQVNLADPVFLLNFLFVSGSPPPPAPFGSCGVDPTDDGLTCESDAHCP